jgi:hypothetical protein
VELLVLRIEQKDSVAVSVTDHHTKQNISTPETSEQKETESSVTKSPSMVLAIRSALLVSILSLVSDFVCVPLSLSMPLPVPVSTFGDRDLEICILLPWS